MYKSERDKLRRLKITKMDFEMDQNKEMEKLKEEISNLKNDEIIITKEK